MKKKNSWKLAVAFITALGPSAFAGGSERALELPDLAQFREALGALPAPASVPGVVVGGARAAAGDLACPVLDLQGATIGRGWFENTYTVKIGGSEEGTIKAEGNGHVYRDAFGNVAAKSSNGVVTDCSGHKIGSIEETAGDSASSFKIRNAEGGLVAVTPATDGSDIEFLDYAGKTMAWVKDDSGWVDRVKLSMTDKADPRLVAITVAMNQAAVYKRSAERRRERMGDRPHGRHDVNVIMVPLGPGQRIISK
jgi:hypothetical protein